MSISRLYSSAVNSVVGLRMLKPTLLTKMFRVPLNFLETSATKASREVASATSHTDPVTSKPTARHCKTAAVTSFAVRAHVWTRAPWRARDSTMAWLGGGAGRGSVERHEPRVESVEGHELQKKELGPSRRKEEIRDQGEVARVGGNTSTCLCCDERETVP